jgi:hypothetical protein
VIGPRKMKSDEYRAHAYECFERASEVRDPEMSRQFKEAAEHWVKMADQIDRFGLGRYPAAAIRSTVPVSLEHP